ncbi:hypothetical protein ABZ924_08415 [Streptomyces sp. NPDC046876]|uniref:hypothetical protein n=1 Tax=Streptomyces sp. NPDC046876 TaxID=3155616 RepID=UPI0033EF2306
MERERPRSQQEPPARPKARRRSRTAHTGSPPEAPSGPGAGPHRRRARKGNPPTAPRSGPRRRIELFVAGDAGQAYPLFVDSDAGSGRPADQVGLFDTARAQLRTDVR